MLPSALLWGHNEDAGMDVDMPQASTAYIVNLTNSQTGVRYTACASPPAKPSTRTSTSTFTFSTTSMPVLVKFRPLMQIHIPWAAQRQCVGLEQPWCHQHHKCVVPESRSG